MNRADVLDEAKRLTTTDRERDYGDCVSTHRKIAEMWSLILSEPIGVEEVALCMAAVKIIRAAYDPKNADHFIDGAAYLAIAGECAKAGRDKTVTSVVPAAVRGAYDQGFSAGRHTAMTPNDCPYNVVTMREAWLRGLDEGAAEGAKAFPEDCSG